MLTFGIEDVVFTILTVFFALLILVVVVVSSRATVVRWVLGKMARLFRLGRRVSLKGSVGAQSADHVVGTSGYAAVKRIGQARTATEWALHLGDVRARVVDEAVDDVIERYWPRLEDDNIDDHVESYLHDVQRRWLDRREELLKTERAAALDRHLKYLVEHYGTHPEDFLKEDVVAAGIPRLPDGQPALDQITIDMVDFEKLYVPDLPTERQDMIVTEGTFKAEEDHLVRQGTLFREISARAQYLPDPVEPNNKMAAQNYLKAAEFFQYDVSVQNDPDLLYEDINDAAIAEMLAVSDRKSLYFLTEWRKIVNRNVFQLSVLASAIISLVFIANYLYGFVVVNGSIDIESGKWLYSDVARMFWIDRLIPALPNLLQATGIDVILDHQDMIIAAVSKWAFALLTFVPSYLAMLFIYRFPYSHFQRVNNTELVAFMRAKTARLSRDYYRAESQARGSFSGDRMSAGSRELAKIWFMNMQWVGFRILMLEQFLRSILYQVKRNSGYYVLGIPALFLLPLLFAIVVIFIINPNTFSPQVWEYGFVAAVGQLGAWLFLNGPFLVLFYILTVTIIFRQYLAQSVNVLLDIDDTAWQNFHEFNIQRQSSELIRHYVGEIYNERIRVRGGGTGN